MQYQQEDGLYQLTLFAVRKQGRSRGQTTIKI
jgi:hypothetical protein